MPLMYWFSRRMTLWGSISFNLAVFINIIIAFFYPYVEATSMGKCPSICCSSGWKEQVLGLDKGRSLGSYNPVSFLLDKGFQDFSFQPFYPFLLRETSFLLGCPSPDCTTWGAVMDVASITYSGSELSDKRC